MSDPNEPASPAVPGSVFTGLTKREAFAMAAMQGLVSNPNIRSDLMMAQTAVLCADALLSELAKPADA